MYALNPTAIGIVRAHARDNSARPINAAVMNTQTSDTAIGKSSFTRHAAAKTLTDNTPATPTRYVLIGEFSSHLQGLCRPIPPSDSERMGFAGCAGVSYPLGSIEREKVPVQRVLGPAWNGANCA